MAKRRLTIRLDSEKERDSEIISYLDTFDKKELRTINNAVLNAVYEFLKSKDKSNSDKSRNTVSEIIPEIRKAISEEISKFFFPLFGGLMNNMSNNSFSVSEKEEREENPVHDETDINDFDSDFMGG